MVQTVRLLLVVSFRNVWPHMRLCTSGLSDFMLIRGLLTEGSSLY